MDVVQTDDHYVLRADLPGLSESDVNIELDDNVLTVSGERKSEHEERSKGYYRVNLKHAISRVRSGERIGLELMFHDAKRS